ncbi:MAG: hypothetical protein ABR498_02710 [Candidatus Dormibacteria bacterium]
MKRRLGRLLVSAPLVMPVALAPLSVVHAATAATQTQNPFDAFIASGNASCLELTVNVGGYSFIVVPDIRAPRSTSTISEGQSGAIAAPVDPGDSVDALPGLLFPREEGQIASGLDSGIAQTKIPVPTDVGNTILKVANPFNPTLEYPIEHASVSYPDASKQGDQESTYPPVSGAPSGAVSDPGGLLNVNAASGDAKAGANYATADSGAGGAASVPLLGVSFGRISSNANAQVTASAVSDDVSCTLQDVTIAPPGSNHSLHVGSLTAKLHTERTLSGSSATSSRTLSLSDLTVDGQNVLAQGGQSGQSVNVPRQLQSFTFPQPQQLLPPGSPVVPASLQSLQIGGTSNTEQKSSGNNQDAATLTAATVTLQSTMPVPATIPSGPPGCVNNPPNSNTSQSDFQKWVQSCLPHLNPSSPSSNLPITSAPTTYTLALANLDSTTYGLPSSSLSSLPLGGTFGGSSSGLIGAGTFGGGSNGSSGKPGQQPTSATVAETGSSGSFRWPVVALAALMESALLGALWWRRRVALQGRLNRARPNSFLDLP